MPAKSTPPQSYSSSYFRLVVRICSVYGDLCSSRYNQDTNERKISPKELGIQPVTQEEVKKALDAMRRVKAGGGDQVTTDLLRDGGKIVLEKLATLYTPMPLDLEGAGIL